MLQTLPRRDRIDEQRLALIDALSRFGYTFCSYYDGCTELMFLAEAKPYYVFCGRGRLGIVHRKCTDCWKYPGYEHRALFLKELIPVIGRLDAAALYDPGLVAIPCLYIYL